MHHNTLYVFILSFFNNVNIVATTEGNKLKQTSTKIADGCGLMGILRLSAIDDAYLILITEIKSVGKLNEIDINKISAVKLLSLNREPNQAIDERIPEVGIIII